MPMSKEEFVARHGEKWAPYYQEYDSDLNPDHNFRILMEMIPSGHDPHWRRNFWFTIGLVLLVCVSLGYFLTSGAA